MTKEMDAAHEEPSIRNEQEVNNDPVSTSDQDVDPAATAPTGKRSVQNAASNGLPSEAAAISGISLALTLQPSGDRKSKKVYNFLPVDISFE